MDTIDQDFYDMAIGLIGNPYSAPESRIAIFDEVWGQALALKNSREELEDRPGGWRLGSVVCLSVAVGIACFLAGGTAAFFWLWG